MDRYGIPKGEDVAALRDELDQIFIQFDKFLVDEECQRKVRSQVRKRGRIDPKHLDEPFTV